VALDQMLAAQLLGMEQVLNQNVQHMLNHSGTGQARPEVGPDKIDQITLLVENVLDERLSTLTATAQRLESALSVFTVQTKAILAAENGTNARTNQLMLDSITQLEQSLDSLQTAMTANYALMSNRLHHHQIQSMERAHPGVLAPAIPMNGTSDTSPSPTPPQPVAAKSEVPTTGALPEV
jgi:hypothetical protein